MPPQFDGVLVQIDFIVSDLTMNVEMVWHDFAVAIGLDHRCVHCMLRCFMRRKVQKHIRSSMKRWRPHLDENQQPAQFHAAIRRRGRGHNSISFGNVEDILLHAARSSSFVSMVKWFCLDDPQYISNHPPFCPTCGGHGTL